MENYFELFVSETEEYLRQLNQGLLVLDKEPDNYEAIMSIFRSCHTIKGMAQTMGFEDLGTLAHRLEDLLGEAKSQRRIERRIVDFFFQAADFLSFCLNAIKEKKECPATAEFLSQIERLSRGETVQFAVSPTQARDISEIRVRMEKLDKLFNLTNELMIARSRLLKISQVTPHPELGSLTETSARLISALKDEVMWLRMLPLSTVFDFFPRWVRDEAKNLNKEVMFEMVGGEIEVDRSIIDILKEPLMHLIRNALDHGIRERGTIKLTAFREREKIMIAVSDNGAGIDQDQIRRLAVERGLVSEDEARRMSRYEVFRLLTRANFSTKQQVSSISGRGLGLDIVDSVITRIGGKLIIDSEPGQGSVFTIELPLSLAVVRAMVFRLDGQRFALPLSYIQETFFTEESSFQTVFHRELYALRDEILPIVRIGAQLGCTGRPGRKSVIVVQRHEARCGFVTDEIIDEDEIVVKKIDPLLPGSIYSGCSIYNDGSPILILDPRGFE